MADTATRSPTGRQGNRVVIFLYVVIVAIAGVMGFVLGNARPKDLDPELFGVIQLPPTAFGTALYGMITVAVGLGIMLGLVIYVSDRYPDA
ncbi:MAG: cox cluster protein [Halorientalis sp.]